MGFDDKQDEKEKRFEEKKAELLAQTHGTQSIDNLMFRMFLDLDSGDEADTQKSIAFFNQAGSYALRGHQKIVEILVDGSEEAITTRDKFLGWTMQIFLCAAFRDDSDFVDEAVRLILDGEAGKYFE